MNRLYAHFLNKGHAYTIVVFSSIASVIWVVFVVVNNVSVWWVLSTLPAGVGALLAHIVVPADATKRWTRMYFLASRSSQSAKVLSDAKSSDVRREAATAATDISTLAKLATDSVRSVRHAVTTNPACSAELLERWWKVEDDVEVLMGIVGHANCPEPIGLIAATHVEDRIRLTVAKNTKFSKRIRTIATIAQ